MCSRCYALNEQQTSAHSLISKKPLQIQIYASPSNTTLITPYNNNSYYSTYTLFYSNICRETFVYQRGKLKNSFSIKLEIKQLAK